MHLISPAVARVVLDVFTQHERPDAPFEYLLVRMLNAAPPLDRAGLAGLYPTYDAAVKLAEGGTDGLTQLRTIAADTTPRCARCETRPVKVPGHEQFFGRFCEQCISNCHEGRADHRCVICA